MLKATPTTAENLLWERSLQKKLTKSGAMLKKVENPRRLLLVAGELVERGLCCSGYLLALANEVGDDKCSVCFIPHYNSTNGLLL